MPELPEVETMCRGIAPIVGSIVRTARRCPCRRKLIKIRPRIDRLNRRIAGRRIEAVERLGKRVVIRFDSADRLILEPRMTGLVLIENPPGPEHLRFCLELEGGPVAQLWFWDRRGLGRIELLNSDEYSTRLMNGRLGPDALAVDFESFLKRFHKTRTAIKVALMDQSRLAGIGNLYASEILYAAKVHPFQPCRSMGRAKWKRIFISMRSILQAAIRHEGSTLSDGTYRNALNDPGSYQNQHQVYDRAGQRCLRCRRSRIRRTVQSQRATFYCPSCQRPGTKNRPNTS